jgi:REP element-mobilizing transposase RayT
MNKPLPNRQSIRLKTYDYSKPGYYFVTICTQTLKNRFGNIVDGNMQLNQLGKIITEQWNNLPNRFPNIKLDQFVVMPNHIHGIIAIVVGAPAKGRAPARGAPTTVGDIVGTYKSLCVHHCLKWAKSNNPPFFIGKLWQRNYWEHIVRNENELNCIRDYILHNPQKWEMDKLNGGPGNIVMEIQVEY